MVLEAYYYDTINLIAAIQEVVMCTQLYKFWYKYMCTNIYEGIIFTREKL